MPSAKSLSPVMAALSLLLVVPQAQAAIILGQVDDFSGGTTQGWTAGGGNPNPPANIPDGGPLGAGDNFLSISAAGGVGSGSRLSAFNAGPRWTGDYLSTGVTAISADLNNLGATALQVRLAINGNGGAFASSTAFNLPASSGWAAQPFTFLLDSGSLAPVSGNGAALGTNLLLTLQTVSSLRILHNTVPAWEGASIIGQLGVDNISAVPEPSTFLLLGFCAVGVLSLRVFRDRANGALKRNPAHR